MESLKNDANLVRLFYWYTTEGREREEKQIKGKGKIYLALTEGRQTAEAEHQCICMISRH